MRPARCRGRRPVDCAFGAGEDEPATLRNLETSIKLNVLQVELGWVCLSGISTGYDCAQIINDDFYYSINGVSLWGKQIKYLIQGGDSGGPTFFQHSAYGFISATTLPAGERLCHG